MTEPLNPPSSAAAGVILLPPPLFFVRRVPLAAGSAPAGQVELALENLSPFPVDQLYHGHVIAPAGDEALVYATHRKQFSAEESAGWKSAEVVLPAFVALLGDKPAAPAIRVWHDAGAMTAAAWDGRGSLPAAVVARAAGEGISTEALVAEVRERTGLATAAVEEFSGPASGASSADGRGLALAIASSGRARTAALSAGNTASGDVREKGFLAERQRTGRRDLLLWRTFSVVLAGLAALVVLELGLVGARFALRRLQAGIALRAPGVEKISTAQTLSHRIEELSRRRLMPFEMIAALNRVRPASVLFLRVSTNGQYGLEVGGQAVNATDVGAYEAALRALPELATVEARDVQTRDGQATFTLNVTFKSDAFAKEAAK